MSGDVLSMKKRVPLSNEEFLKGIFGDQWERAHVTSFKEDPYDLDALGLRHYWGGAAAKTQLQYCLDNRNTYYVISLFELSEDGKARRRKDLHEATYVITIDDVYDKVPAENLANLPGPSYKLETSENNEQWGYILETPETNQARVDALLNGLVAAGIADDMKDPGMKGVTRYVRLPVGSNTKKKYGVPFKCKLISWQPDKRYRLEDLARPFGIDVTNVSSVSSKYGSGLNETDDPIIPLLHQAGIFKGKIKPHTYDVECPWVHEHTGAADSGAAYLSPFGFRCHHGHCDTRNFGDLMDHLETELPGSKKAVSWAEMIHSFDDHNRWPFEIAKTWKSREDIEGHKGWLSYLEKLDPLEYNNLTEAWDVLYGVSENTIRDIEDKAENELKHEKTGGLRIVRPSDWAGKTPAPREWEVDQWLPRGKVTSLYGDGGLGKTLIAQMLATSLSIGLDWLGEPTEHRATLCFLCEDDEDEIFRRQADINSKYMLDMSQIGAETQQPMYMCREGQDNLLMKFENGIGGLTPLWYKLRDAALAVDAQVIIIDTIADTFGGNEISRLEVRQFVQQCLLGLSRAVNNATILVLGHPSQAGKSSGQGFSGSTAWNNSVRSRWYIDRVEDTAMIRLSRVKSNYSASGSSTDKLLLWENGAFKLIRDVATEIVDPATGKTQFQIDCENIIYDAVTVADTHKVALASRKNAGELYLPTWAKRHVPGTDAITMADLEVAMDRMFDYGVLIKGETKNWYRAGSNRKATGLGISDASPLDAIDPFGSAMRDRGGSLGDELDPFG